MFFFPQWHHFGIHWKYGQSGGSLSELEGYVVPSAAMVMLVHEGGEGEVEGT